MNTSATTTNERIRVLSRHMCRCHPAANATAAREAAGGAFRYTLDPSRLTMEQRRFYEDNGYVVVPRLVDHQLLDECSERFRAICEGRVDRGAMTLMADVSLRKKGVVGEYLYNKLQDIAYEDVLSKFFLLPEVLDIVESFTGPNIMALNTMLINKPPDSGALTSRHPLHQDLHYLPIRPADRIVTVWTAMERVNKDNGCLSVVPGSHHGALLPHEYPKWEGGVNKGFHAAQKCDDVQTINLNMEKGDTLFFHSKLLHGSGANHTKGFRKAMSCQYAASECEYIDVRGTTHENIAREIEDVYKRRCIDLEITDFIRLRSRLARGHHITL